MESSYEIRNLENQNRDVGTCQNPFFYHITTGKFLKKSIIFHAQIGRKYHEYHIRNVNSETLNLVCTDRSCPARAHVRVPKSTGLITVKRTRTKTNGCQQKIYQFNCADPKARDLKNYIFLAKNSAPHSDSHREKKQWLSENKNFSK